MVTANNSWPFSSDGSGHANGNGHSNGNGNGHSNGHPHAAQTPQQPAASTSPPNGSPAAGTGAAVAPNLPPKPYFVPPEIRFEMLPRQLQIAIDEIIGPTYRELVLDARNALERQAGASLTLMLYLELIEQREIGRLASEVAIGKPRSKDYDKQMRRWLRILKSKDHIQRFLMRLQAARLKSNFPRFSLPPANATFNPAPFSPPPPFTPPQSSSPFSPQAFTPTAAPSSPTPAGATAEEENVASPGSFSPAPGSNGATTPKPQFGSGPKKQEPSDAVAEMFRSARKVMANPRDYDDEDDETDEGS